MCFFQDFFIKKCGFFQDFLIKKCVFFQDKIDIDFQSEYLRDDDDDVFNSEEDENENAMFQQLNRDIDIFNRDVTCGVDSTLRNSGDCFVLKN